MADNTYATFSSDVEAYIAEQTLPLLQKQLVAYDLGTKLRLPKNRGKVYTATRYNRVTVPIAALSEGIPPVGETMTITQVSATAQQWGDTITVTDVADLTIKHPVFQKAIDLIRLQMVETFERNTFNALMAGTQINYANAAGSRAALTALDVMTPHEINRMVGALTTLGAPKFNGQRETDTKLKATSPKKVTGHYVAIIHPLVEMDLRENSTIVTAWSYSDLNKLYNEEIGEWGKTRFTSSNMVPTFTGVAAVNGTAGTAGNLATGTYYVQVTGNDTTLNYESQIYQVSTGISVTGSTGSISVTVPSTAGFTYNVYIGTTTSPTHLAKSTSGPTTGPLAGMAAQIAPGTTVVLTDTGISQTPPAAPATGVTIYPSFFFGMDSYGIVALDDVKFSFLKGADKSDPLNQLRVVGWKAMYSTIIMNQNFFGRTEAGSAFSATFG